MPDSGRQNTGQRCSALNGKVERRAVKIGISGVFEFLGLPLFSGEGVLWLARLGKIDGIAVLSANSLGGNGAVDAKMSVPLRKTASPRFLV